MDITAIICEYNPFHNGHQYQLNEIRNRFPETSIISVMSPNFVQRGTPAVFDKYVRGECSVRCGVDLAVSMPQAFALLSAEGFAEGGVKLARKLGANAIAFGVEDDDLDALKSIAEVLIDETFELEIKKNILQSPSISYPSVRQRVLEKFIGASANLISTPNNILAVEYIKACLRYYPDMEIRPIKRIGKGYADLSTDGEYLSATAIRSLIYSSSYWGHTVPRIAKDVFKNAETLNIDRYENLIYAIITSSDYEKIYNATASKELSDTIYSSVKKFGEYRLFRESLSRKKFTETKIDRALASILLNVKKDEYMHAEPEYATLLGLNSKGREILKRSEIEIISKYANANKSKSKQLLMECFADRIWARCTSSPQGENYFINKKPYVSEE